MEDQVKKYYFHCNDKELECSWVLTHGDIVEFTSEERLEGLHSYLFYKGIAGYVDWLLGHYSKRFGVCKATISFGQWPEREITLLDKDGNELVKIEPYRRWKAREEASQ